MSADAELSVGNTNTDTAINRRSPFAGGPGGVAELSPSAGTGVLSSSWLLQHCHHFCKHHITNST